jgi:predicted RNA-binding Zn ribbon-like protein
MEATELANTGDHPALSFVNTYLHPWGEQIDLLASGADLLDWMVSVGLIDDGHRRGLARRFARADLDAAAARARETREWLRGVIDVWSRSDGSVPLTVERRLNRLLVLDKQYLRFEQSVGGVPQLHVERHWETPEQLVVPMAAAAADLLATGERDLIRICDGPACSLWFYDRTKAHRRRWCSQAVCGNRDKVRNHRTRAQVVNASS